VRVSAVRFVRFVVGGVVIGALALAAPRDSRAQTPSGAFKTVHCLKYAGLTAPLSGLVVGIQPDPTLEHPMVICVAQRPGQTVVLDSGFVDEAYGKTQGVNDFTRIAERLGDLGVKPEDVDLVTLGHLHWDHAGGTSAFPNARFVLQRRELEFAAVDLPGNKCRTAFAWTRWSPRSR
jgi:glyoxylase-like metal-dependent hydrolase (beta-lactamase superfamily II)